MNKVSLKDRFRKAIYSLFEKEIRNSLKLDDQTIFRIKETELQWSKLQINLDLSDSNLYMHQDPISAKRQVIENAEYKLFEEFKEHINHIELDDFNEIFKRNVLTMSVYIGKPKN